MENHNDYNTFSFLQSLRRFIVLSYATVLEASIIKIQITEMGVSLILKKIKSRMQNSTLIN